MGFWSGISSITELAKAYPDETHLYTDASYYMTYADVVTLTGDDYYISLQTTSVDVEMPLLTCVASIQNFGNVAVEIPLLTASGQRNNFGQASLELPLLTASAFIGALTGSVSARIPMMTVAASMTQEGIATLAKALPRIKISAYGYQYNHGDIEADAPMFTISASAYENLTGNAALSIPVLKALAEASSIRFSGYIIKPDYDVWGGVSAELPMMTVEASA